MKQLLLTTALLAGLAASVLAQGVLLQNTDNIGDGAGPDATTGGLVFIDTNMNDWPPSPNAGFITDGSDLNITLWGGTSPGSLLPIETLLVESNGRGDGALLSSGAWVVPDGAAVNIPGATHNSTVYLQLQMWTGTATSWASAGMDPMALLAQSPVFQNPSGGGGTPPTTPPTLTGMPSILFAPVPELLMIALAGLGAAASCCSVVGVNWFAGLSPCRGGQRLARPAARLCSFALTSGAGLVSFGRWLTGVFVYRL